MTLDENTIKKIAHLARLELAPEELSAYLADLNRILSLIEELKTVDTNNVAPLAHPEGHAPRWRNDEINETDQRAKFQELAPSAERGLYLVPRVVE